MMDLSNQEAVVVDNGLFCEIARVLAKSFGHVYIWTPWESVFPLGSALQVGVNIAENVTRVESIWDVVHRKNLTWVFPDICHGPLQAYLASRGQAVWGARNGEKYESFRGKTKKKLKEIGLPVGPYIELVGIPALREYLRKRENLYIKTDRTRGDFETFKHENFKLSEPKLDELSHTLGARQHTIPLIVEEAIPDAVELGYDGFRFQHDWPTHAMSGLEIKGRGYVGRYAPYAEVPEPLRVVNDAFAPLLEAEGYVNWWCAESRITMDQEPYVIDPCCRAGSPPSESSLLMTSNLAEVMYRGARGEAPTPEGADKWVAQLQVYSSFAEKNWQSLDFPEKYRDNISIRFPTFMLDRWWTVNMGQSTVGSIMALGGTMEEAIKNCRNIAKEVRGYCIEVPADCFDEAEDELSTLKSFGLSL